MTTDTTEPESETPDDASRQTPATSRRLFVVAAVACVIALVAAVVTGTLWFMAAQQSSTAAERDEALSGARQAAVNLNSVDSNNLDQTFADIESSITGEELTNGLADTRDQFREQFSESGVVTTATVERAALVGFDPGASTAASLIVLQTDTQTPEGRERFQSTLRLELADVDGVWRATRIQPIGQRIPLDPAVAPDDPAAPAAPGDPAAPVDPNAPVDPEAPAEPAPNGGG